MYGFAILWGLAAMTTGCSETSGALSGRADETSDDSDWGDTGTFGAGDQGDAGDAGDEAPPEVEQERFLAPAQTDVYVFVANPDRDTVTRVNVATRAVRTARVGREPSLVEVTSDYAMAVVFNKGDDTVSLLDASTLDETVVPVRDNLNAMRVAPDGGWAVLWHDVASEEPGDGPDGAATSYHEISLVDLMNARQVPLVVGFNPKDVAFTPDGTLALVVADASLVRLDLTQDDPEIVYVEIADPLSPPSAEEVVVTPDGHFAFIRQFGADDLTVVDLDTQLVDAVPVGTNPTDLDLSPDGFEVVVVSRGSKEIRVFDAADPFAQPALLAFPDDTPFGSVLLHHDEGILFTTASAIGRYATWDRTDDSFRVRPLPKPVRSISVTPPGTSLLVEHTRTDSTDGSTPAPYRGEPAVSLIDLSDFRANTIALASDAAGFVNSADGTRGYLILEGQPFLEVLDYRSLIHDELALRSVPLFVGVLPDLDIGDDDEPAAWVSQEHPLGRLSFYDPDDGALQTLTGFELNSAIEE